MPGQSVLNGNLAAGVVPAAPWRVQAVSVLPNLQLAIAFRDGLTGIADFSGIETTANPGVYASLADSDFFGQVRVELGVPTWSNGADLDPAWLHENLATDLPWSILF